MEAIALGKEFIDMLSANLASSHERLRPLGRGFFSCSARNAENEYVAKEDEYMQCSIALESKHSIETTHFKNIDLNGRHSLHYR